MNNIALKIRFSLLSKFGMIPKTSKIEEAEKKILDEYKAIKDFENSDELKRYKDLHEFVNSDDFKTRKKEINAQRFKDTEAYKKEQRLKELAKSSLIKTYFKVKDSDELAHFNRMKDSEELDTYYELDSFYNSPALKEFKEELEEKRKAKKQEYEETLRKYRKLNKQYKWFYNFRDSETLSFYEQFSDSDKWNEYIELEEYVRNVDLKALKNQYKQSNKEKQKDQRENYKDSEEYKSYLRFKELSKDPEIKRFKKIDNSKKLNKYNQFKNSQEIKDYEELHDYVNSSEFEKIPEEIDKLLYKNTQEYENYKKYKQLCKSPDIKKALKFKNSKDYQIYLKALESDELKEYKELKDYVESDEFKEIKNYMKTKDKFKLSDEYKDLQEYKKLKNSENIQWYYKRKDSSDFDFHRNWSKTFYDDFDEPELNKEKWLTQYYLGKMMLNEGYSQATDKHLFTNGDNLKIEDSILTILTQKEKTEGKFWHPKFGFYPKKFDYTSGMINSAESFRQKYGIFRAKVKVGATYPMKHAFWMVTSRISPEIDIFSFENKSSRKVQLTNYWGQFNSEEKIGVKKKKLTGPDFSNDYYIFSLEWKPGKLIWKINGITVKKEAHGVPDEPLFMIMNSGVQDDGEDHDFPGQLQIDWVEAYQEN
jgi:hypothetical protein